MVFKIIKDVRDVNRLKEIVLVLFDEGFSYAIGKAKLSKIIPLGKRMRHKLAEKAAVPIEVRLRKTLERLGPTFIKFGQMLSVRPDLMPKEYIAELEKLQDSVPPFSFEKVKKEIEQELRKPIKELFRSFEEKPVASASISQVHKAILKNGKKVAVKVQRPETSRIIESDIEIMKYLAKLIEENLPEARKFEPVKVVKEFSEWTIREINFEIEARNAKRFYYNFKDSKLVKIPKIYDEYTTKKILVMEFIEGTELHKLGELKKSRSEIKKALKNGLDAILTQVFVHGFFHADPHPGNIIVMKDGAISFVDFGIVGYFDDDLKQRSIELLYGIISGDAEKVAKTVLELSGRDRSEVNLELLTSDIRSVIGSLQNSGLKDIHISRILAEVMDIALEYKLKLPMAFVLLGKTIMTIEGIGLKYDPDFKIVEHIKPFAEKVAMQKSMPANIAKDVVKSLVELKGLIENLPRQASGALERISKGSIKINLEDTDINKLALEMDRSSNRLAYGMIIAALLVAGALIMQLTTRYTILGINILSLLLFSFAAFLGMILFFSILRERKLR